MDLHIFIVIACVFLASLFSLLLINKFFRRKTFEEIVAEKKALASKMYGTTKIAKKQQQRKTAIKKELKKDKKQRQKDAQKETEVESTNDSDGGQSETQSVDSSPVHTKPTHIEFEPEPEIVSDSSSTGQRRPSTENTNKTKQGKKKSNQTKAGILVNKSEPIAIKEVQTTETLNHFESKQPKDAVELKKHEVETKKAKEVKKSNKNAKKDIENEIVKEIKQVEEKPLKNSTESPKSQNNKAANKQQKKKEKDLAIIEKLDHSDTIGVNLLMNMFNRAELNRNEIQILIDYLLNKQQDMPDNHSDWSDDVVQKLRKQLEEKDKLLQDEQDASAGIQAKLRDLRSEINSERAQMNATIKAYIEKIQIEKNDVTNLNQEVQNLNEKINLERQQFQVKLLHEKQAFSQELLAELQQLRDHNAIMQNDLAQKNAYINEMKLLSNASHQADEDTKLKMNEVIQQQLNQVHLLEQKIAESDANLTRQQYEMAKNAENDKEIQQNDIRNLENALDSAKAELNSLRNELNASKSQVDTLSTKNAELAKNLLNNSNKNLEQCKEQSDLQNSLDQCKLLIADKDRKIAEYEKSLKQLSTKEDDLIREIQEQKEKNNQQSNHNTSEQQKLRQLLDRLYPEAVKKNASSALTLPFDQWFEQILSTVIKQLTTNSNTEHNSKTNSNSSNTHNSNHTSNNHNNISSNSEEINSNSTDNSSSHETEKLKLQNVQLRARLDELTKIVNKTENMLTDIETQARKQDAHWRSIVQSKDDEINLLKTSNGEQDI